MDCTNILIHKLINLIKKLNRSLKKRGIFGTLKIAVEVLHFLFFKFMDDRFDRRYGTDTSAIVEVENLQIDSVNQRYSICYQATTKKIFNKMINSASSNFNEYVFVDFGSGKGRVLLLASKFPFRKIVGVEFSRKLHIIARHNINLFLDKTGQIDNFELHFMDVTQFVLPPQKIMLFLYNPFQATVMKTVLDNLASSYAENPRDIIILYRNPECASSFNDHPYLKLVTKTSAYHIYAAH